MTDSEKTDATILRYFKDAVLAALHRAEELIRITLEVVKSRDSTALEAGMRQITKGAL